MGNGRPNVPAESPTLGLAHLQFEALLAAAKQSASRRDLCTRDDAGTPRLADLPGHGQKHREPPEETAIGVCACGAGRQGHPRAAAPGGESRDRTGHRRTDRWTHPADLPWKPDGTRTAPSAAAVPRGTRGRQPAAHAPSHAPTPSSPRCSTPASTCETYRARLDTPTHVSPCAMTGLVRTSTDIPTTPRRLYGLRARHPIFMSRRIAGAAQPFRMTR